MTKKQYSDTDVEQLLQEAARQDRRPMEADATERFLDLIRKEAERHTQAPSYKRLVPWAVAAAMVALAALLPLLSEPNPVGTESALTAAVSHPDPSRGAVRKAAGMDMGRRAFLSHIDGTMEAGFGPAPQEIYQGNTRYRYGASVYGKYEYKACTDTL